MLAASISQSQIKDYIFDPTCFNLAAVFVSIFFSALLRYFYWIDILSFKAFPVDIPAWLKQIL